MNYTQKYNLVKTAGIMEELEAVWKNLPQDQQAALIGGGVGGLGGLATGSGSILRGLAGAGLGAGAGYGGSNLYDALMQNNEQSQTSEQPDLPPVPTEEEFNEANKPDLPPAPTASEYSPSFDQAGSVQENQDAARILQQLQNNEELDPVELKLLSEFSGSTDPGMHNKNLTTDHVGGVSVNPAAQQALN